MSNDKTLDLRDTSPEKHLAILEENNPDLRALLSVYPEEQADKILKNKDKLRRIIKVFSNVTGYCSTSASIMTCHSSCPHSASCILRKQDMAPFGYPCPIERKLVAELQCDIAKSLEIDSNDPIEMELLWDLIDTKLLDMRSSGALRDGSVVQVVESSIGKMTTSRQEIAPALEIKLDLKRLKHSIIDQFVATRRAKKKYGMQNDSNILEQLLSVTGKKPNGQTE